MTETTAALPNVYVYYSNHFDLIWRRGWQRGYEYEGLFYRGYADLEDAIISRWLTLAAEQGGAFQIEQALSLREYLRRHPDALPSFQRLAREGRFELLGSGEAIIDVNMCHGETMARNLASGTVYARRLLGQDTKLACHADGFGSSAQFPQVIRRCGMRGVTELSYCKPDAPYWRGLDGSTVFSVEERPGQHFWHDNCYYEPCLTCRGHGTTDGVACPVCQGTGQRLSQAVYPPRAPWTPAPDSPHNAYLVNSEEMLPDETLFGSMEAWNAEGKAHWRWKTQSALLPVWEAALARVDDADLPLSSRVENNPTQTGTLVTRSRVKRAAREAEAWFYAAEKLSALATRTPQAALESAWLKLPLLFFHDAVNGTHIDPAHAELLDEAREVVMLAQGAAGAAASAVLPGAEAVTRWDGAGRLAVFNPHSHPASLPVDVPAVGDGFQVSDANGRPVPVYRRPDQGAFREEAPEIGMRVTALQAVGAAHWDKRGADAPRTLRFLAADVPPFGTAVFDIVPAPANAAVPVPNPAEAAGYRIGWDDHGINSLALLSDGQELLPAGKGPLGHLILEEDRGDPWGTRYAERARTSFAPATRFLGAVRRGGATEIVFGGRMDNGEFGHDRHPSVFGLEWLQTVRLLDGLPAIEVEMEIFWQAVDHRLRVAFPTRATTDRGLYHIPYGVLARERYEMTEPGLWSPNGDWPVLHFTATEPHGSVPGLAVLNTGTPSARIEDGTVLYSVARSPGFGHCLNRYAQEYPMPTSEMRDGGWHRFRFAVLPYTGENLPQILEASAALNSATPSFRVPGGTLPWASGLALAEPGAAITAVKTRFDGAGLALRVVEQLGQARTVTLSLPPDITRARTANLLEDPEAELPVQGHRLTLSLRPFEIATVLLD